MAELSKISGVAIADVAAVDAVLKANIASILGLTLPSGAAFLLDTYTGAAAGYSVRRIASGATNLMRIREDSGDTETDIGYDSNGDLDTAAIATHCGSANGYVVTWYDQAGSNNATQSTNASQPQIYDGSSVITENGKPAVDFDGSSSFLGSIAVASATANTIATVLKPDSTSSSLQKVFARPNASSSQLRLTNSNYRFDDYELSPVTFSSATVTTAAAQELLFGYVTNTNKTARLGKNGGTFDVGDTLTKDLQIIGTAETDAKMGKHRNASQEYYDGKIQEFVLWTTDHGTSNRTAIETNINSDYLIYQPTDTPTSGLLATYSGAAAAYSVRQLANTAVIAMTVRRDDDDEEKRFGFDENGDLDTAGIASFCGSANGYVSQWWDQSTNGNHASQGTAANQPQIYNGTAVITENGKPVLNATYAAGAGFPVSLGLTQPFTYAGTGALLDAGWMFGFLTQVYGTNNLLRLYAGSFYDQSFSMNNRQHIAVAKFDGASSEAQALTSSGSTSGTGNPGTSASFNYILHRRSSDAAQTGSNMQEMIFWNVGQSSANMDGIETNMDNYYSVS